MSDDFFQVSLESDAEADLRSIASYLAEHADTALASAFVEQVLERVGSLERFPLRGAVPKELQTIGVTRYRQLLFGRYRIIYSVADGNVTVVLIADVRRNMAKLLRNRLLARDPRG